MTLFRWLLGTRLRLAILSLAGIALWFGLANPAADYVRHISDSTSTNLLIKLGMAFVMLFTATFLGILIGDFVFPGRWRERVLLDKQVDLGIPNDSLAAVAANKTNFFRFCLLIVALIVGGVMAIEAMTGGFLGADTFTATTMRGSNTAAKLTEVEVLRGARAEKEVNRALSVLDTLWRDPQQPRQVREASVGALGDIFRYLVDATDEFHRQGMEPWQGKVAHAARRNIAQDMRAALGSADETTQAGYLQVLAQLRLRDAATDFLERLDVVDGGDGAGSGGQGPSDPRWEVLVRGLGRLHNITALPRLVSYAEASLTDSQFDALAWGTRELLYAFHLQNPAVDERRLPQYLTDTMPLLIKRFAAIAATGSLSQRCLAVVVLKQTRDEATRAPLFAAYDAGGARGAYCAPWDGEEEAPLRHRIVDALAMVALGSNDVLAWARERLADGGETEHMSLLLSDLIKQIEANQ